MKLRPLQPTATKAAIGLAISGLILWCAAALHPDKPAKPCPLSPDGQHDYMRDGLNNWECWWCQCAKPK